MNDARERSPWATTDERHHGNPRAPRPKQQRPRKRPNYDPHYPLEDDERRTPGPASAHPADVAFPRGRLSL